MTPPVLIIEQNEPRCSTDLDMVVDQLSATCSRALAPLTDAVRDASGAASLGYLVSAVDITSAMVALCSATPDITATADLMIHEAAPLVHGPTVIECNLARAGARLIAVSADIYDGDGMTADLSDLPDRIELPRVATGIVNFARVARTSASKLDHVGDPLDFIGRRRHWKPFGELPVEPLPDRCGLTVLDPSAGVVELPNTRYVHNNRDRISGGVLGILFQAAAEATHPGYAGSDIQIHFLASARVGPIRTRTFVVREAVDHAVCRITAADAGADDLVVAQATVTLQRHSA